MQILTLSRMVAFAALLTPTLAAAEQCRSYGPPETVTGRVERWLIAPIDREEDIPDKEKFPIPVLQLDQPICTREDPINTQEAEQNVRQIQMVGSFFHGGRNWYGRQVEVTGKLYHSHTGHHHTEVLIQVESIREIGPIPKGRKPLSWRRPKPGLWDD